MNKRSRLVAAIGAGVVLVSGGTAVSSAAAGHPITGGQTTVAMNSVTVQSIRGAGLGFAAIAPATKKNGVLRLPNSGGAVNPTYYVIRQAGGFQFTKGAKTIKVTHIVFDTRTERATADVTNHGNIVLFVLGQPNAGGGAPGMVQYGGYSVTFAPAAIRAFDNAFHTAVFAHHAKLGTGSTTVRFAA